MTSVIDAAVMAGVQAAQSTETDVCKSRMGQAEGYDKKCIFCKIVNNEMGTELLHSVRF